MPVVKMPDGTQVRFPDDMSREQIRGMIEAKFPDSVPQQPVNPQDMQQLSAMTQGTGEQNHRSTLGAIGHSVDSAVRGAADTATFGLADELSAGLGALTGVGGDFGDYSRNLSRQRITQAVRDNYNPYSSNTGRVAGALGTGVGIAKAGLSPTVAAVNAGWRLPGVALASGIEGAALGAAQGFGSGEGVSDRLNDAITGAKYGGALGAAMPVALAGLSAAARKVVSPFASNPERQAAVNVMQREGVPLSAGQKTGSKALQYFEAENGGNRIAQMMEDQGRAFTDAAMRKAGGSGLADEGSLQALQSRLSKGFEDLSARNTLKADAPLLQDMLGTLREYNKVLAPEQQKIFGNIVSDIGERIKAGGGSMAGSEYQTIRSRLGKRAFNAAGADNELADAYRGIRNALDAAMERSIQPGDAGLWSQLRRQYGNSKVLMKAAKGAGEDAALGVISPARLRMAASSGKGGEAYVLGNSDFSQLAKAGQATMTPLPNSGTAGRLKAQNLVALAPTVLGAGAGGAYGAKEGGWQGGLLGALAGAAAPRVAGRIALSAPAQRYLANQAATGQLSPEIRGLLGVILNMESGSAAGRLASP